MKDDNLTDEEQAKLDKVSRLTKEANEHYRAGQFPEALPLYQEAFALEEEVFGPDHPSLAGPLHNLGNLYYVQEKYGDAEAAYLRALSLLESQHGPDAPELADPLLWLAETRFRNWQYEEAKEPYSRAVAILEQQSDVEKHADALMRQAHLHYFIGEYAESEPLYLRALELREQALGAEHISVAHSAGQLARLYHLQPEFGKEAGPLFRRALAIREKALGAEHPDVAESLYRLADHLRIQNRLEEAEPLYVRAMAILDAHPELPGSETSWMRSGYIEYLRERGRESEAKALEERVADWNGYEEMMRAEVEKREATLGPEHPELAASLYALANSCFFEQNYDEAESYFLRALEIREKALGPNHPEVAASLNGLAKLYRVKKRYEEAGELIERAARIHEQAFGREHAEYAFTLEHKALLAEELGDPRRAEEFYRETLEIYGKVSGEESREYAETLFHFTAFHIRQEQFTEAEAVSVKLMRVSEKEINVCELEKADYFELRAHALEKLDRVEEAEALRLRVKEIWAEAEQRESTGKEEEDAAPM